MTMKEKGELNRKYVLTEINDLKKWLYREFVNAQETMKFYRKQLTIKKTPELETEYKRFSGRSEVCCEIISYINEKILPRYAPENEEN